jgi:glycosyltransferase involved in cell wall biosynthesis
LANMPAAARRIEFRGRLEGKALAQTYLDFDVLVVPSYREVWGLVVNEALAAGLYVIASDQVGSARDLLDAEFGVVVKPGDRQALARAMLAATRASQSLAGRQHRRDRVASCTADGFADDLVNAVSRALEMRGRNRR